ncbi:MAG: 3'-5' exonuclease [Bacteroidia bacterium]|nr:3'-5' exonuclease [Bacteroidia bacterium]
MDIKVAISADFLTAFAALPRQVQGKTTEFINKFRNNPKAPGINYEKINEAYDKKICSVRIDDTYRGIVARQEESGVYLLLWVDHHDEAYDWAKRKRCEVNQLTGAIQVYDMKAAEESAVDTTKGILGGVSDNVLVKLGLPEVLVAFVKSLSSAEAFYEAKKVLPSDAFENIMWLVEGFEEDEVLQMLEDSKPEKIATEDMAEVLDNPENLKSFVVVDGEDELKRIMAEPLEKWRVFLHPTQRKIVGKTFNGPARVLGGAGTGKTVVAMHRAKHLASKANGQKKILFTTFTTNLASDIKWNLKKICSIDELRRIEVINLDAWVNQYLREQGYSAKIASDDEIKSLWEEAVTSTAANIPFTAGFFEEEWNKVVIAQEALTLEKYVKVNRNGRGTRLDRKTRMQIWPVFEYYQRLMKERDLRDNSMAMYECRLAIMNAPIKPFYDHIIVDEGQDLSDNAYKLIRLIAGEEHQDDIFIVGDAHQRIYKNRAVLSRCGVNVKGRSSQLRINYRTTEETRKYAFALLKGIPFDDLDDSYDDGKVCRSLTHGDKPEIKNFKDASAEAKYIAEEIKKLQNAGIDSNSICVVARTHKLLDDYVASLTQEGLRMFEIKRSKNDDRNYDGIRIATMHRVKGLEFSYVFIAAVNKRVVPLNSAIDHTDAITEVESMNSEKCLLYVALTRAQRKAYITSYGAISEFLD